MKRASRGRGIRKNPPGRPPVKDTAAARAASITFPVTDRDDEMVECSNCGVSVTYYEFRVHNIEAHYNLAKTVDDEVALDHKYFVRKLQEMAKLTKIASFFCPRKPCESTYKSALGLAFHLETCGKTVEEIAAVLVECEHCHKKYTVPNLKWHKRTAHPQGVSMDLIQPLVFDPPEDTRPSSKRKSAMKAREFMKELSDVTVKAEIDEEGEFRRSKTDAMDEDFALTAYHMKKELEDEEEDQEEQDDNFEVTPSVDFILGSEEIKLEPRASASKRQSQSTTTQTLPDFAAQASKYLEAHPESATDDPWDTPLRVTDDPLREVLPNLNSLQPIDSPQIREHLPLHEKSVLFNTRTKPVGKGKENMETEFHRLNWFEGKVVDSSREEDFLSFTGGPVTSIAWHPSGQYLAISTLRDTTETPNMLESGSRLSSIQFYCPAGAEAGSIYSLRLILGLEFGYVNDLRWSSFWPLFDDPESDYAGREDNRIGYLCAACEDSTCRLFAFRQSDFDLTPTFASQVNTPKNVPVYKKVPEMTLCQDEAAKLPTGQCGRFDWDEGNRYVIAGYASGHVGVFDLFSTSKLLRTEVTNEDENSMVSLNPVWLITSHFSPVTAVIIDPKTPRYFYTGSMDRTLRTWDLHLKQEMECKKVGGVIDMCWIRGWIHLGVSVDAAISNPGSQYNFLRYYPVGSSQARPNAVEYFNIVSTSFFEGMTLAGSENGRVTISYYDSFWRECDYDRNKKKKNVINIGKVAVDENSFQPLPFAKRDEDIRQFPEGEEPQLTFIFCRDRCQGSLEVEPSREEVENVFRFYRYTRVNKVCWSPNGKYITIGYRNGLFAILPADFDKLFT